MPQNQHNDLHQADEDRRKFLSACGKFAVVTPPAITLLLSTSLNSTAVAQSAGHSSGTPRSNNQGQNDNSQGDNNNQ